VTKNYADAYNKRTVPDETAKKLLNDYLAVEEAELKLKRSYVPKLEKAIPGMKVARYLQIENKDPRACEIRARGADSFGAVTAERSLGMMRQAARR
jgi:hypothetical protein